MVIRALVGVVVAGVELLGCGARAPVRSAMAMGDELTLYRDHALIKQRVDLEVPVADLATVRVVVAAGTSVEDIVVLDRGELTIVELRGTAVPKVTPAHERMPEADAGDEEDQEGDGAERGTGEGPTAMAAMPPNELTFVVSAPRPGRYALHLGYVTDRIDWDAAYTLTTTPARERVTLRGAVAIRNTSGVAFRAARVFVVDAELGAWRGRVAAQLGSTLAGTAASTTPVATPHALGVLEVAAGETRIELVPGDPPRPMRSVLVYDPIGTTLDHGGSAPIRDATLGADPQPQARVTESFEIARTEATGSGLPGGPVRLLERRADGTLTVLGEARLFDASARIAEEDTVAIGTAEGVTGRRERRELTLDDDGKRLVEEFVLTIANTRSRPVEVVLREHLYRGQNWTLAYQTAAAPKKEGPQQISLRTVVPARSEAKVLYVVVYTWP